MSNRRSYIHFSLVFRLLEKGAFTKHEVMANGSISQSTFDRAVSDLRCYLMEFRPWQELVYDRAQKRYFLETIDESMAE